MATTAVLRQRVLDNLYDNSFAGRPKLQRLAGAVADSAADTTVAVDNGAQVSVEDVIEFASGEQGLVWAVAANNLTVVRGYNGTATAVAADNSFISLNPKWTIKQVNDALAMAVADLEAQQVFEIAAGTNITLVAGTSVYSLVETDFHPGIGVLAVWYKDTGGVLVGLPFRHVYDPLSEELTGDLGVRLLNWGGKAAGATLHVTYAKKPVLGSMTEAGLETAAVSYATGYLMRSGEGPRVHDPGRHTDRTVQPGQALRNGSFFMASYQREVWRYRAALRLKIRDLPGRQWRRSLRYRKG